MASEVAIMITVPIVLEAIGQLLNIPKEKMQEYYDTSEALRNYVTSLTSDFNTDIENKLMQVTPSTTPRFDIPWVTEELRKKQQDIFNIKKEISKVQTDAYNASKETWRDSKEKSANDFENLNKTKLHGLGSFWTIPEATKKAKKKFYDRKKAESDNYTKQTIQLQEKLNNVSKRPLINNNPTYQTIQERKKNAQLSKKQKDK